MPQSVARGQQYNSFGEVCLVPWYYCHHVYDTCTTVVVDYIGFSGTISAGSWLWPFHMGTEVG